jgi:hypothetical protein
MEEEEEIICEGSVNNTSQIGLNNNGTWWYWPPENFKFNEIPFDNANVGARNINRNSTALDCFKILWNDAFNVLKEEVNIVLLELRYKRLGSKTDFNEYIWYGWFAVFLYMCLNHTSNIRTYWKSNNEYNWVKESGISRTTFLNIYKSL